MSLAAIILAAGRGTRMRSERPKALHRVCGRTMLGHLLAAAGEAGAKKIVVVAGYQSGLVRGEAGSRAVVVRQRRLLGSGHAVRQAAKALPGFRGAVLVLYCDTPLVSSATLGKLIGAYRRNACEAALLSARPEDPAGYGRVEKDGRGFVRRIVEETDAGAAQKALREVNVGCYVFRSEALFAALARVSRNPVKKEYYLTDAVGILAASGKVAAVPVDDTAETLGINTQRDLMTAENLMQQKILDRWIDRGVRLRDPRSTTIDAGVEIGHDTVILPHTVIEDSCVIGKNCVIGPFARIRGGSKIGDGCVIGNFVEVVRSVVGEKTQIKHLSYIGDARIGAGVNVGAGAITANFDGKKKHKTVIKDKAQIGSGTILVAPVTVGRAAKTGAGSVIPKGKNVPAGQVVAGVPARFLGKH
ncbi:MAG: NTP transferase domain-containing protein [Candidatus Omnitrophica bacterium]|nr:NTP transferase domain-containing protein [Candidatus Omnitrophota bacterium]